MNPDASSSNSHPHLPQKWLFFGVFVLLVIASNFVRRHWPYTPTPEPGQQIVETRQFAEQHSSFDPKPGVTVSVDKMRPLEGKTTRVALRDLRPTTNADAPVVLLLHGAPGTSSDFAALAKTLSSEFRVLAPDLPGAGASQREVADYSAEASAYAMLDLLDKLDVKQVHVLGAGQGGIVALNLAYAAPQRVKSLSLVSSSGVQEFELLGNQIANNFVYFFHKAFIGIGTNLLPHFGLFDRSAINHAYARVFSDTDCSRTKEFLHGYAGPVFIAHGADDILVPQDAAEYSAKVAPQARTFFTPGGHHVFEDAAGAALLAPQLTTFFHDADSARAALRPADTPALDKLPPPPPAHGSRLAVLMLIIIACALVAEDPTCLATGVLVAQGILSFGTATAACLISIFIGDFSLYLIGYVLGRPALRKPPLKWLIAEYEIDRMAGWFEKKGFQGLLLIVTSRFIPASRLPTFICAGVMRLSLWRLSILFFIAAALWTPALIWVAEHFGSIAIEKFPEWKKNAMWIVLGALFGVWFLMHVVVPSLTWRGRREQVMKLRHWARHEFWSVWQLYLPIALAVLLRGLARFRGAAFTAANPGLGWLGGFTGEEKSETLGKFSGKSHLPLAAFAKIRANKDTDVRVDAAKKFMQENALTYPVALKPDAGDDGLGVNRIANEAQLAEWLARFNEDALLQRWVNGVEFEVVWTRLPGATHGHILSVVEKNFVSVVGDGHRTLEELIWADDIAVSQGKLYLRLNWRRASEVIPAGEVFPLTHIGTHALGARMLDRQDLRIEILAQELDKLADAVGGLHYAVYDFRVDASATGWGRGAKAAPVFHAAEWTITGVSGAGVVSSRLRDQSVRLGYALASARRQIHAAFIAADENRRTGTASASFLGMLAAWSEARSRQIIDLRNAD
jgi:pimeloyl-ACP methyl ester carboxylesterase/membrane protein DedA with SNARE-associated domain